MDKQSAAETLLAYKKAAWSLLVSKGGVRGPQKNEYWEEDVDYYGCTVATRQKETLEALALIQADGVDWNATTDPANHMGQGFNHTFTDSAYEVPYLKGILVTNKGDSFVWLADSHGSFGTTSFAAMLQLILEAPDFEEAVQTAIDRATDPNRYWRYSD